LKLFITIQSIGVGYSQGEEIKSTTNQAEQFFNHFESNGWLVGGKAKMKDWKAAAKNWVKRSQNFRSSSGAEKPIDRLHTNQDKDYSMPL